MSFVVVNGAGQDSGEQRLAFFFGILPGNMQSVETPLGIRTWMDPGPVRNANTKWINEWNLMALYAFNLWLSLLPEMTVVPRKCLWQKQRHKHKHNPLPNDYHREKRFSNGSGLIYSISTAPIVNSTQATFFPMQPTVHNRTSFRFGLVRLFFYFF